MNYAVKVRPNSRKEEVLNVLKRNPNSTTKELSALMPHIEIDNISHAVSSMADKNIVFVTGKKSEVGPSGRTCTHRAYSVKYENSKDASPKPASKLPTQSDLFGELVNTLEAEVTALQQWKEAALLRYPDLGIDPLLLEARALLAAEAERQGVKPASHNYINGNRDNTIAVQALVKALGNRK
jgi:hypothetical protein